MSPDTELVKELVRRIVESVQPLPVILFGSGARTRWGRTANWTYW